jgi:arabinose 5-phosphate isomerase
MTRNGVTLQAESRAVEAKERLMKHKISAARWWMKTANWSAPLTCRTFIRRGSFKPQTFRQPMQVGDVQLQRAGGAAQLRWFASSARLIASAEKPRSPRAD